MSVKKSQLETKVVPVIQGLLSGGVRSLFSDSENARQRCDSFIGNSATEIISNMYGRDSAAKKQFRVIVTTLSDTAARLLKDELKAKTFSFNIAMSECEGLVCFENWWNGVANKGRPCLPVHRGKSPGFCVFIHEGEILAAVNMYHSNFSQWADRIGLRKTMKPRTVMPSTHFVYAKEAKETGLLWVNPKLEWM